MLQRAIAEGSFDCATPEVRNTTSGPSLGPQGSVGESGVTQLGAEAYWRHVAQNTEGDVRGGVGSDRLTPVVSNLVGNALQCGDGMHANAGPGARQTRS